MEEPTGLMEQPSGRRPEFQWTNRTLTSGTLVSGFGLLVGLGLTAAGVEAGAGDPRRLDEVIGAAMAMRPWGWSMMGVLVLLATPAAALVATFFELRPLYPRTALLALAVLVVLTGAALFAFRVLA